MSLTYFRVSPPDIYHRLGLAGMQLAKSAMDIRATLTSEGRWEEVSRYEEDYVRALQEGFDEIDRVRRQIVTQASAAAAPVADRPAVVSDQGIGAVEIGGSTADGAATAAESLKASVAAARSDEGVVDLSGLLGRRQQGGARGETLEGYVTAARARLDALVPLSEGEHARVDELRQQIDGVAGSKMDAAGARRLVEGRLAELERDLAEGGAERPEALVSYLALCQVMGETPRSLGFAELLAETARLERAFAERRVREVVADKVSRALERSGLAEAGTFVLNGVERRLLVDEDERDCALALAEGGDGSFVLSTVSSSDPTTTRQERRARIEASMHRLCSSKRARFLAELEREGLVAVVGDGTADDIRDVSYCAEFALIAHEDARGEAGRAERGAGRGGLRMAGDE